MPRVFVAACIRNSVFLEALSRPKRPARSSTFGECFLLASSPTNCKRFGERFLPVEKKRLKITASCRPVTATGTTSAIPCCCNEATCLAAASSAPSRTNWITTICKKRLRPFSLLPCNWCGSIISNGKASWPGVVSVIQEMLACTAGLMWVPTRMTAGLACSSFAVPSAGSLRCRARFQFEVKDGADSRESNSCCLSQPHAKSHKPRPATHKLTPRRNV
mmetsp:Transcript_161341/g.309913  ORF Transcript_161341/g.309913 Transcript_161341/m.309913 type:complete len:219 (-) Transcript_161341:191-847(-)